MTLIIRDATNTARTVTGLVIRDGTNTPRTITELWVRDTTNTPRKVYTTGTPLSVLVSPTDVFDFDSGTGTAIAGPSTATPSGGTAPYTYAWTLVSHSSAVAPTATLPTQAVTTFQQTGLSPGDYEYCVFRCTVTDSAAATASADVSANFYTMGP